MQDGKEDCLFISEERLSQELSNRHPFTCYWSEQDDMLLSRPILAKRVRLPCLDYFIL